MSFLFFKYNLLKKIQYKALYPSARQYELSIHLVCLNNSYYWNGFRNLIIMYYPNTHVALCRMGVCCNSPLLGRKGVMKK